MSLLYFVILYIMGWSLASQSNQHRCFSRNQNEAAQALQCKFRWQDNGIAMILSRQSKLTKVGLSALDERGHLKRDRQDFWDRDHLNYQAFLLDVQHITICRKLVYRPHEHQLPDIGPGQKVKLWHCLQCLSRLRWATIVHLQYCSKCATLGHGNNSSPIQIAPKFVN